MSRRRAAVIALAVAMIMSAGWWLAIVSLPGAAPTPAYVPVPFAELDGWRRDRQGRALIAFLKSCAKIAGKSDDILFGKTPVTGLVGDWRAVCGAAALLSMTDDRAARRFFESRFVAVKITSQGRAEGLFTGYYEPQLRGSRTRTEEFSSPLYRRPDDLITVDLGLFRSDLAGRRIAGRSSSGVLRPYDSRARIEGGALGGKSLELVWLKDPMASFFLHIQGSGQILLDDGSLMRVGFAGQNGHPYSAIGRLLVERGELFLAEVSMPSIKRWLALNPDRAPALLNANASYIFFREIEGDGPIGSHNVVLTAGRSLAVDRRFVPLGAPIWLETQDTPEGAGRKVPAIRRLMIAQDTGGAIKGAVRGDVFFGSGDDAGALAGHMRARGRYFMLVPKALGQRLGGRR